MKERVLFLIGLLLVFLPFIKVFSVWKEWFVFSLGIIVLLIAGSDMIRKDT